MVREKERVLKAAKNEKAEKEMNVKNAERKHLLLKIAQILHTYYVGRKVGNMFLVNVLEHLQRSNGKALISKGKKKNHIKIQYF